MPKPKPISAEDFQSWKDNVITQAFFAHLKDKEAEAHRYWVAYLTGDNSLDPVAVLVWRAELRAKLELMEDIRELELSDIQEEAENAEPVTDQRSERVARRRQA